MNDVQQPSMQESMFNEWFCIVSNQNPQEHCMTTIKEYIELIAISR